MNNSPPKTICFFKSGPQMIAVPPPASSAVDVEWIGSMFVRRIMDEDDN